MSMDNSQHGSTSTSVSEIEEDNSSSQLYSLNEDDYDVPNPMATISEEKNEGEDDSTVYVAVGKSETSMEALSWTLKNLVTTPSSTLVYLIHVFPEINHIPNPCKFKLSSIFPITFFFYFFFCCSFFKIIIFLYSFFSFISLSLW